MEEALVGGALGVLLIAFVSYGYAGMQHGQTHGFLGWLKTQALDTVKAGIWLTEQLVPLSSFLLHELGKSFDAVYSRAARWIGGLENYIQMTGASVYNLALALNTWSQWLVRTEIPKLVKVIPGEASALVRGAEKEIKQIEKDLARLKKLSLHGVGAAALAALSVAFPFLIPELEFLKRHWKALLRLLAAAGAIAIPSPLDLPGALRRWVDRELAKLWHLIRAKEKGIVAVVSGAAVAVALRKLGLGWVRCTKVTKLGKAACGMPLHLFEDLLGLLSDVLILTNICQVIPLLNTGFNLVEPLFEQLTTGTAALACEARHKKPVALGTPALHLIASPKSLPTLHLP